jgi:hypothetical protein
MEGVYQMCLTRLVDPRIEEHAMFLAALELRWLLDYQRDQERFLRGPAGTVIPGCAETTEALLAENADIAWNGAMEIGALYGVCSFSDGRWTIECRDNLVASGDKKTWTIVIHGPFVPTPNFDESELWPETSHPLDEDGRAADHATTPESGSDSDIESDRGEIGPFRKGGWSYW